MSGDLEAAARLDGSALGPCALCGKLILECGSPVFYRVTIRQCGVDAKAVRERLGLAMLLGGGSAGLELAGVMGAAADPVVILAENETNVCLSCSAKPILTVQLLENVA